MAAPETADQMMCEGTKTIAPMVKLNTLGAKAL